MNLCGLFIFAVNIKNVLLYWRLNVPSVFKELTLPRFPRVFNPLNAASVCIRSTLVNPHRGERIYTLIVVFIAYRMLTWLINFRGSP